MRQDRLGNLLSAQLSVVNLGLEAFAEPLRRKGVRVVQVDWKPPAGGDQKLAQAVMEMREKRGEAIEKANQEAVERILSARPTLVGIGQALLDVPGMGKRMILHAGPPVTWERMCGPLRGGVIGGILYEGWARNPEEAVELAVSGEVSFEPCHHHQAVGPMAGIITPSMPVWILENKTFGNKAFATLNEGLGKVLRYGAYSKEVIEKLKWMEETLAPVLAKGLSLRGEADMKSLISQALQMGDEGHNRNRGGTSLLFRELCSAMVQSDAKREEISQVLDFLHGNDHFFLNLTMASAKCSMDPSAGIEYSSLIYCMARNGTDFGIRVSGLGDRWYTAPAPMVQGLYLPGFSEEDAAPDMGDSAITETYGIGGFAMAAAPAIVKFVGGSAKDALTTTRRMSEITLAENNAYQIPYLDFRGTPTGIDLLKVVETGILPAINTGIAHKEPGIGMVGAGLVKPPAACFLDAAHDFIIKYL
ncbi:MAG: hypothetical protein DDT19_01201 [Syntrophomonadaceae bacterium]|nr:hypothetical protein [Bacillota bacterium]